MNRIAEESRRRLVARRNALARSAEAEGAEVHANGNGATDTNAAPRLTETERLELAEIDAALARIELGTYGHCEVCSGAIGRQRLLAVPLARRCINCASSDDAVRRTG